jgi:hypothetical protein
MVKKNTTQSDASSKGEGRGSEGYRDASKNQRKQNSKEDRDSLASRGSSPLELSNIPEVPHQEQDSADDFDENQTHLMMKNTRMLFTQKTSRTRQHTKYGSGHFRNLSGSREMCI